MKNAMVFEPDTKAHKSIKSRLSGIAETIFSKDVFEMARQVREARARGQQIDYIFMDIENSEVLKTLTCLKKMVGGTFLNKTKVVMNQEAVVEAQQQGESQQSEQEDQREIKTA